MNKKQDVGMKCFICNNLKEYKLATSFKEHCWTEGHKKKIDEIKSEGKYNLIITRLPGRWQGPINEVK